MFASARKAASLILDPAFRGLALRAILLTLAMFVGGLVAAMRHHRQERRRLPT